MPIVDEKYPWPIIPPDLPQDLALYLRSLTRVITRFNADVHRDINNLIRVGSYVYPGTDPIYPTGQDGWKQVTDGTDLWSYDFGYAGGILVVITSITIMRKANGVDIYFRPQVVGAATYTGPQIWDADHSTSIGDGNTHSAVWTPGRLPKRSSYQFQLWWDPEGAPTGTQECGLRNSEGQVNEMFVLEVMV